MTSDPIPDLHTWVASLESRHLADLRVPELTRALRALSSAYVERRHKVSSGAPLDTAGKRAAFALFYGPLHFMMASHVVRALGAAATVPDLLLDLGCGTGAAGAAWAVAAGRGPRVLGLDRHPWTLDEARRTYRHFGLRGQARHGDLRHLPPTGPGDAIVAAYVLNELPDPQRQRLEEELAEAARRGAMVLVLEPIARSITPWWGHTSRLFDSVGGRADEWRVTVKLPPLLQMFDEAAGLEHRELTARSLFAPGHAGPHMHRDERARG